MQKTVSNVALRPEKLSPHPLQSVGDIKFSPDGWCFSRRTHTGMLRWRALRSNQRGDILSRHLHVSEKSRFEKKQPLTASGISLVLKLAPCLTTPLPGAWGAPWLRSKASKFLRSDLCHGPAMDRSPVLRTSKWGSLL